MRYLIISSLIFSIIQLSHSDSPLAARLVVNVGEKVAYFAPENGYDILSCVAVHEDQTYSIYPVSNLTNSLNQSSPRYCAFGFTNTSLSQAGKWTIYTNHQPGIGQSVHRINIYVHLKTTLLPKNWLVAEIGNYVSVFPQFQFPYFTSCKVRHYNLYMDQNYYNLMNNSLEDLGIERYQRCGVRIRVDESKYGTWELLQNDGQFRIIELEFKIWKPFSNNYSDINVIWHYGLPAEIGLPELTYVYCKITQPDGRYTVFEFGNCTKKIAEVNSIHEGVWVIEYYIPEHFGVLIRQFNVKIKHELKSHDNITITIKKEKNKTHLLCTLRGKESEFCLFTKPDGSILNVPQGIGNNKYEYYGKGYDHDVGEEPRSDCGLTIHESSADDFGLWECLFGNYPKSPQNFRAFISLIDIDTINKRGAYVPNRFYIKQGDSLQIECPRYASLIHCWIYSPNGTVYSRSNHISERDSVFKNRDLAAGICSTTIENADHEHSGSWSCLLSTVEGDEIKVSNAIIVSVTDSYLYADQDIITINENEKTLLTLNILPNKYAKIIYCRWYHPNGTEIERKDSSQYSVSHNEKSCTLIINGYTDENIGKWICYAGLLKESDGKVLNEEVSAAITIIENRNNTY